MFKIGDIIQNDKDTCMIVGLHGDRSKTNLLSLTRGLICFDDYKGLIHLNEVAHLLGYIKIGAAPITFTTTKE